MADPRVRTSHPRLVTLLADKARLLCLQPLLEPRPHTSKTATLVKVSQQAELRPAGNFPHRDFTRKTPLGIDRLGRLQQHLQDQSPSAAGTGTEERAPPLPASPRPVRAGDEAVRNPVGAHEQIKLIRALRVHHIASQDESRRPTTSLDIVPWGPP